MTSGFVLAGTSTSARGASGVGFPLEQPATSTPNHSHGTDLGVFMRRTLLQVSGERVEPIGKLERTTYVDSGVMATCTRLHRVFHD